MKCPHCDGEINPASLLAKEGVKKHGRTSEQMKELQAKRVYKKKIHE